MEAAYGKKPTFFVCLDSDNNNEERGFFDVLLIGIIATGKLTIPAEAAFRSVRYAQHH
jgi:hypothetical protein